MALFLVTGGAGFIGSHLSESLLAQGHEVRILDDLSTGRRDNVPAGARLILGDVADPDCVRQAMAGADGCFHLAAIASVQRATQDWMGAHRVNLGGTIAVLDSARRSGARVVYASSAAVYGDCSEPPLTEESPKRPLSAYGADKLGSELHAAVAGHVHQVATAGLRFFNVYGPRQDPSSPYSGVISIFCDRLRAGRDVTVFGDGAQTRDFIFVGDVVRALIAAMARADTSAPVFNVCTGRATAILGLAHAVAQTLGVAPRLVHAPPRAGDIRASLGDPAKARRELGFSAAVPLADGLAATLAALPAQDAFQ